MIKLFESLDYEPGKEGEVFTVLTEIVLGITVTQEIRRLNKRLSDAYKKRQHLIILVVAAMITSIVVLCLFSHIGEM